MTLSYLSQKELCKVNIPHIFTFCCCCYWVAMSTLGDSMDCSIPGSSVLHYVLEFAQICVHWVNLFQFSSVQLLNCVRFFATPWTAACEASLFITNSRSLLKLMSIESVMPSNHLILCRSLLLPLNLSQHQGLFQWVSSLHQVANIGVSVSASVLPMNTQDWSPLEWTGWISLQSKGLSRVFSNTTVQKHQFFGTQLSL